MLGGNVIHHCVSGDVAHQYWLVTHEVLPKSCVRPAIEEVLQIGAVRPIIWIGNQNGLLYVVSEIATRLDLSKSVMEGP